MHQGAWFVWGAGAAIVVFSTSNPLYLVMIGTAAWVVHAAHRRAGPTARSFRSFVMFGAVALFARTALSVANPGGMSLAATAFAAQEGLRLAVLLVVFGTLSSVSDPFAVVKLAPRRLHEAALAASLAMSLAPRTILAAARVREAQRMRGIEVARWRSLPALVVPVLQGGMEEALTLAESMDARGHGHAARSQYRRASWRAPAVMVAGSGLGAAVSFVVLSRLGDSSLGAPGDPLALPEATVAAVAGVLVLAVPGMLGPESTR